MSNVHYVAARHFNVECRAARHSNVECLMAIYIFMSEVQCRMFSQHAAGSDDLTIIRLFKYIKISPPKTEKKKKKKKKKKQIKNSDIFSYFCSNEYHHLCFRTK